MGNVGANIWRGYCPKKTLVAERDAFVFCGASDQSIIQEDIYLDGKVGSQNFIHAVTCKSKIENAKKIVMIHGFGGGAAVFMRMVPLLQENYEVISIDLLGMGASGRPEVLAKNFDRNTATDFFTDSLRAFFDKTKLSMQPFILLGHSFGGLISSEYALKYPDQIEHLVLMSPLGLPKVPDNRSYDKIKQSVEDSGDFFVK